MPPLPLTDFTPRLPAMVADLRALVEHESPSGDKAALDRLGERSAARLTALGAAVRRHPQVEAGDHWQAVWGGGDGGILLLVHLDTVYPVGTLAGFPWSESDGWLHGPGTLDMKASLVMALHAVEALQAAGRMPSRRITLLCTSDEETGSRSSRALIERLAAQHEGVLCLEPALSDGALKTWRKGVGIFRLEAIGRAAHAGADPDDGVNAILEMAHQALRIQGLADRQQGTTLNVGVIQGGTRSNVVPESCRLRVDLRALTTEEAGRVEAALNGLQPVLPGARLRVEGGLNRPPMPRTPVIAASFERARALGAALGLDLAEGGTGGGSDANFVAGLGRPLLDGLGAVGEGAHSERERVRAASLPERCALLAALLTDWP